MPRSLSAYRLALVAVLACAFTATSLVFDHQTVQIKIGTAFAKGGGGGGNGNGNGGGNGNGNGGGNGNGNGNGNGGGNGNGNGGGNGNGNGNGAGASGGAGAGDAGHGHGGASGSAGAGSSGSGASGNVGGGASGGNSPGRRIVHPVGAPAAPQIAGQPAAMQPAGDVESALGQRQPGPEPRPTFADGSKESLEARQRAYEAREASVAKSAELADARGHPAGQATTVVYGYPVEIGLIEDQSVGWRSDQPLSAPPETDPGQDRDQTSASDMGSQVGSQTGPGGPGGGSSADAGYPDLLTRAPAHVVGSVNHALLETVGIVSRAMPDWLRDMSASEAIAWLSAFSVLAGLLAGALRLRRRELD